MPKYQGESEDSTASKKERLRIKKKKKVGNDPLFPDNIHLPFPVKPKQQGGLLAGRGKPPVRRGLHNPIVPLLKMMEKDLKLKKKQDAEERKRNEEYKKRAKRSDRMS